MKINIITLQEKAWKHGHKQGFKKGLSKRRVVGRIEGRVEGREEGRSEERKVLLASITDNLKRKGFGRSEIAEILKL